MAPRIKVMRLGQSGFRLEYSEAVIYADPYLSDYVERINGKSFARLTPSPMQPHAIVDATVALISHIHPDHCDPDTLLPLSRSSPHARFLGPFEVIEFLKTLGIADDRMIVAKEDWISVAPNVRVRPVPAAHKLIERDSDGLLRFVGFVMDFGGRRVYHAGDTCVHDSILGILQQIGSIEVMFLPVNECNFYRDRIGIVGNMSIRDAFSMAEEVGSAIVVPMHYDMFRLNSVFREEIETVYRSSRLAFRLLFDPTEL